jgi:sugar-specific transcriptional regulator TrmB
MVSIFVIAFMEKQLKELGFEEKEISVYLACLQDELNTPTSLGKKIGLKRATIYFYLDKLKQKGLITYEVKGSKKYISALSPKQSLKRYIQLKKDKINYEEEIVKDLVSQLGNIAPKDESYSKVYHYEGEEGLRFVIDKILELKEDIYWIGSIETLLSMMGEKHLYRLLTVKRLKQGTTTYAITDKKIIRYLQFSQILGNQRHFRFLNKEFNIPAVLGLFGDHICLISKDKQKIKIVLVKDVLMFKIVHFLFESLWVSLSKE